MESNTIHNDDSPCPWWMESHHRSSQSQWLQSTLSEVENKVKTILDLIEGDGDNFAMRAEMYYQKRPQLIKMVQDLRSSYCALANKHDLLIKSRDSSIPTSTKGKQDGGISSIEQPNFDTESLKEFSAGVSEGSDSDTLNLEFYSPENLIVYVESTGELIPNRKIVDNLMMQENELMAIRDDDSKSKGNKSRRKKLMRKWFCMAPLGTN